MALACLVDEGPLRLRLTHAAQHLVLLRMNWTVPKGSFAIAERVSAVADELTKEPLATAIEHHVPHRRHISPKEGESPRERNPRPLHRDVRWPGVIAVAIVCGLYDSEGLKIYLRQVPI